METFELVHCGDRYGVREKTTAEIACFWSLAGAANALRLLRLGRMSWKNLTYEPTHECEGFEPVEPNVQQVGAHSDAQQLNAGYVDYSQVEFRCIVGSLEEVDEDE